MRGDARMNAADHARPARVRGIEADDRRRGLAERHPDPPAVRADPEVVRTRADEDAVDDLAAREIDHRQLAGLLVRDVRESAVGRDPGDLRSAEREEDRDGPERVPGKQQHRAGGIDDDGRAVRRRGDHQRIRDVDPPEDTATVRAERNDKHLVRRLGGDECNWAPAGHRTHGGRQKEKPRERGREREESAHASSTARGPGRGPA